MAANARHQVPELARIAALEVEVYTSAFPYPSQTYPQLSATAYLVVTRARLPVLLYAIMEIQ